MLRVCSRVGQNLTFLKIEQQTTVQYIGGLWPKIKDQSRKDTFLNFELPHGNGEFCVKKKLRKPLNRVNFLLLLKISLNGIKNPTTL